MTWDEVNQLICKMSEQVCRLQNDQCHQKLQFLERDPMALSRNTVW